MPELVEGGIYKMVAGRLELVEAPKRQEVKIKANETYKSVDGRRIVVWAINKESDEYPVVGCILTDNVWKPMIWNFEGITKRPYGRGNDVFAIWNDT